MAISSISSNVINTDQTGLKANTTKFQTENTQSSENPTTFGDTVNISDEAQNRQQSIQASSSTDSANTTDTTPSNTTGSSSSGRGVASSPAHSSSAGTASSGSTSSTSTSNADKIAKLVKEIQALQEEITALAAKALSDETAKSEMASEQKKMAELTAELTQLQAQQA